MWTPEQVLEDIEYARSQEGPIVLVAQNGDGLAGFLWGYRLNQEKFPFLPQALGATYLDDIAVDARKRGAGIGSMLCEAYFGIARAGGFSRSVLRTSIGNSASMALFRKEGYVPVERDGEGVFDPAYSDRLYLWRDL